MRMNPSALRAFVSGCLAAAAALTFGLVGGMLLAGGVPKGEPRGVGPRRTDLAGAARLTPAPRDASLWPAAPADRAAQDRALEALARDPSDRRALRDLAAVRRRVAGGDATQLRRDAAAYRRAAAEGRTTGHYTPVALTWLAIAADLAIEAGSRANATARPPARPAPERLAGPDRIGAPPPAPSSAPQFRVQVGPVRSLAEAQWIDRTLTALGLRPALVLGREPLLFGVTSGALPRAVAERRRAAMNALGVRPTVRDERPGFVRLDVGGFGSREAAETAAAGLRRKGIPAVVRPVGGTGHVITLGPYARSDAQAAAGRIRASVGAAIPVVVEVQAAAD